MYHLIMSLSSEKSSRSQAFYCILSALTWSKCIDSLSLTSRGLRPYLSQSKTSALLRREDLPSDLSMDPFAGPSL